MATTDYDVIVVGSGLAGLSAALNALESGARVLVVEATGEAGGASRLSTGFILGAGTRFQTDAGIEDSPDNFFQEYMNLQQWKIQPALIQTYCYNSAASIEWLADQGVEIVDIVPAGEERFPRAHITPGGEHIISVLEGRLQQYDSFDIALQARVNRLVRDERGISGIRVENETVTSKAVVLATGGFGSNAELIDQFYPSANSEAGGKVGYVGSRFATGDAFQLGKQIGARIVRGRGSRAPHSVFSSAYLPSFAVLVNQFGRRFQDESIGYGVGEAVLAEQPDAIAHILFDDCLKQSLRTTNDAKPYFSAGATPVLEPGITLWRSAVIDDFVERGDVLKAQSLEELAVRLNIDKTGLRGTVKRYNQHVKAGFDADFLKDPAGLRAISQPPFYSTAVRLKNFGCTGIGLGITNEAQVLHEDNLPLTGLFAAGECSGGVLGEIYYGSGASLANALIFGRIAGTNAARLAQVS